LHLVRRDIDLYHRAYASEGEFDEASVADTLLTTAIVVLVFEWFLRVENERRLSRIVGNTVREELGPLAESLFSQPETVLEPLNNKARDNVIRAALALELGDKELADTSMRT
jgi:hypothetical protein